MPREVLPANSSPIILVSPLLPGPRPQPPAPTLLLCTLPSRPYPKALLSNPASSLPVYCPLNPFMSVARSVFSQQPGAGWGEVNVTSPIYPRRNTVREVR